MRGLSCDRGDLRLGAWSGIASVIDGMRDIQTHAGSAHGRRRRAYRVGAQDAMPAVNAAHTLATFTVETWDARRPRAAR